MPCELEEKTDKELIEGYLRGVQCDFEKLYDRHKRLLYGYLFSMLPNQHAVVDDIFQQTWIKVLEKMPEYKCSNKFRAWLTKIAHNLTIDYFRKTKKYKFTVNLDDPDANSITDDSSAQWEVLDEITIRSSVNDALASLKLEQREVFIMRQNKISFKEIAVIQKSSINTVLARMQYAVKNIQKYLAKSIS
jgi:RNA polymerase sigma-70 factor (ECF subfamily)